MIERKIGEVTTNIKDEEQSQCRNEHGMKYGGYYFREGAHWVY
ncbi:hypothetical protein [Carboxylicivirga sediminis]|nr:hypothetical protein [Carboxylicivirga sediminis]